MTDITTTVADPEAIILNLTANELAVLTSLAYNDYGDMGSDVWSWAINNSEKPSGLTGKALAGVVSSICKKGLYKVAGFGKKNEDYVYRTQLGDKVFARLFQ